MGCIYKIENKINHKVYIGQTIRSASQRKCEHWWHLKRGNHRNKHLQNAVDIYGLQNFVFCVIEDNVDLHQLNTKEQYYIQQYNSYYCGYNLTLGGDATNPNIGVYVYRYDEHGYYNKTYKSYSEAARDNGLTVSSIRNQCIIHNRRTSKSKIDGKKYIFSLERVDRLIIPTAILQLDDNYDIIEVYLTQSDVKRAFQVADNNQHLGEAIREKRKWRNYYWCVAQDYIDVN